MKKKLIVGAAAAVALVVLAYPTSTWWISRQVEVRLSEQYARLSELPFVKVTKRDFERGFASSTDTVTFELFGELSRKLQATHAKSSADAADMLPLALTIRNVIRHGPIVNIADGRIASAVVDSEIVFEGEARAALAKLFGDKKPLSIRTVIGLDGGGRSTLASPPFEVVLPGNGGQALEVKWDGITADIVFASEARQYTMQGAAPRLVVSDRNGMHAEMTGMRFEAVQHRAFVDEPLLFAGTQRMSVDRFQIADTAKASAPAMSMQNLTYDILTPVNGEYLDLLAKLAVQGLEIEGRGFGPVRYEISLNHLHARTMAKLYRAMMGLYADPTVLAASNDPSKLLAPLAAPAMELLQHGPELRIDRISVATPQGEAKFAGHLRLKNSSPEDFSNVFMLIGKLDVGAEIELPEALGRRD